MIDEEKLWAAEVNRLVTEAESSGFKGIPPIVDLSIAHELGMTPEATAQAICGFNRPAFDAVLNEMRSRGLLEE